MNLKEEKRENILAVLMDYYGLPENASNEQVGIALIDVLCEVRLTADVVAEFDFEELLEKSANAVHAIDGTKEENDGAQTQEG